jgi:hypothetical protein
LLGRIDGFVVHLGLRLDVRAAMGELEAADALIVVLT